MYKSIYAKSTCNSLQRQKGGLNEDAKSEQQWRFCNKQGRQYAYLPTLRREVKPDYRKVYGVRVERD